MADLSRDDIKQLARLGAKARLEELRAEDASIRKVFPGLFTGGPAAQADPGAAARRRRRRRRRRSMSAAARKAVSERMTEYWAERRKAKAKGKGAK